MAIAEAMQRVGPKGTTDQLVQALEGLRIELPEDPPGFTSFIDPQTHQISQAQAIGEVVPNGDYPPAKVMLGRWVWYPAQELMAPPEVLRDRMERASHRAHVLE